MPSHRIKIEMDVAIIDRVTGELLVPNTGFTCEVDCTQFVTNPNSVRIFAEHKAVENYLCQLENKFVKEDPITYSAIVGRAWRLGVMFRKMDFGINHGQKETTA